MKNIQLVSVKNNFYIPFRKVSDILLNIYSDLSYIDNTEYRIWVIMYRSIRLRSVINIKLGEFLIIDQFI